MPETAVRPRTLRALLVGIDAYEAPVSPLRGCVNDVRRVATWLAKRAAASGDSLALVSLVDREATRERVIETFRQHLGAATASDTVLFYYSGHGAQETALPEHLAVEPDGLNETLVLADSRRGGVFDLADKELAVLVAEVSATAGHVLVVLDCCHSGSGVRGVEESDGMRVRRAATDTRPRPPESYLAGAAAIAPGRAVEADWLNLAGGRYVLLAACRSDQTAKEMRIGGVQRGAFSVGLERALDGIGGAPTYVDVERWVAAAVRNLSVEQDPVLEAPRSDDAHQPFLGGAAAPATPARTASHVAGLGWTLDAGMLHGIAPGTRDDATEVSLHPLGTLPVGPVLTTATVTEARATTSVLEVRDADVLDREATYLAVVTRSGRALATVAVHGDGPIADDVRARVLASKTLKLVDDAAAHLVIEHDGTDHVVTRPGAPRPLASRVPVTDEAAVERVVATAEHIGWWIDLSLRDNPSPGLGPDDVEFSLRDRAGDELEVTGGIAEVRYVDDRKPEIAIRFHNASARDLHCAVLGLTELYGVHCLTVGGSVLLKAGSHPAWVTNAENQPFIRTEVPEDQERTTDQLKLLVSTEPFDAQRLQQAELPPPTRTRGPGTVARGFDRGPAPVPAGRDWTTRSLLITTVRPGHWASVPSRPRTEISLTPGVRLVAHPRLRARARLAALPTASREAEVSLVPPALLDPGVDTQPFSFGATRSVGEELSVLEFEVDAGSAASVTEDEPLLLHVDQPLGPGDHVFAVASDGEDHLPLGRAVAAGGTTEIRLDRIPGLTAAATRSLGGSLKILFRKMVLRRLGFGYPYPLLSLVRLDGGPSYLHDPDEVAAGVRDARRVLLVVHGIIGDTRGMAASLAADPIRGQYDAVLALDYENIGTGVDETAADLAARVRDLHLDTGQRIDVLAHSMGGLVSRWWIEREGGAAAVRRLVTCGTPHGGSPWPRVQDLATAGAGLVLNGLGPVGTALGVLVRGMEMVDKALDDMQPGSPILSRLAGSPAPSGVRYVAVTGDQPFGAAGDTSRAGRIFRKLRTPQAALDLVFGRQPHDLAVSVASASAVGTSWPTRPTVVDADCSHLTYFSSVPGMEAVRSALSG